jgi:hypothetical protein
VLAAFVAVPADESSDGLEIAGVPEVSPDVTVAPALSPEAPLAAVAEAPDEAPLAVPLVEPTDALPDEPPVLVTPLGPLGLPPAAALAVPEKGRVLEPPGPLLPPVDAAAAAAAAVELGGGERLPDAGKCPPPDWSLRALFVAGLRADDLAAALASAAAKSLPSVFWAEKQADAAPPVCAAVFIGWATLMRGGREITGIAFIPVETASDVPSDTPQPTILR